MVITTKRGHRIEIENEGYLALAPEKWREILGKIISHYCYLCDKINWAENHRGEFIPTETPGTRAYADWVYGLIGETVIAAARENLIYEYLSEHSGYRDLANRYSLGQLLSDSALREVARAHKYADENIADEITRVVAGAQEVFKLHFERDLSFCAGEADKFARSEGVKITLNRPTLERHNAQTKEVRK